MKYLFSLIFFICSLQCTAQDRNFRQEGLALKKFLVENHVQPRAIDDKFSKDVFAKVLHNLDPAKAIFTQNEVVELRRYELSIDNELNGVGWNSLPAITRITQIAYARAKQNLSGFKKEEFDLSIKQNFQINPEQWPIDEIALKTRQAHEFRFRMLRKLEWYQERDSITDPLRLRQLSGKAFDEVMRSDLFNFQRAESFGGGIGDVVALILFQSVASAFDPHTEYLAAQDVREMQERLSSEGLMFGFEVDENQTGAIFVSSLKPGGPAWKSGEFNVGDILLSAKTEKSSIDFTSLALDDTEVALNDLEGLTTFTIRKADGQEKVVKIRKEKLDNDDVVRSFILDSKDKIGYIHLPDFYTRWGDASGGSRCADDVAREIVKLKKDGIKGLILDVRYNGGGSLFEAMAMSGIFIDEGPLGIFKDRSQKLTTLKDMNRGTIYDGPLVILVNGYSASASEFLAAALQDYNRAIIVGSQTFGKGTGQEILAFNNDGSSIDIASALAGKGGVIKITKEKLYRVTGKSVQGRGVTPDIALPVFNDVLAYSEKDLPFFIHPDSVEKNQYFKPLPKFDTKVLQDKSSQRVSSNEDFHSDIDKADLQAGSTSCLCWDDVKASIPSRKQVSLQAGFPVQNNTTDEKRLLFDDVARQANDLQKMSLANDQYVREAFMIISDFLTLMK